MSNLRGPLQLGVTLQGKLYLPEVAGGTPYKGTINGQIAIDLTQDTVTPEALKKGITAHSASGEKIVGIAELPPASGDVFSPSLYRVSTPSGEPISSGNIVGGFITVPPVENGFIFLNWDVTKNDDLDSTMNFVPAIMYVYIPSINVDKGMVTILDVLGNGYMTATDNWVRYIPGASTLDWTDAFRQTDYTDDMLLWGSKSGYSTFIRL